MPQKTQEFKQEVDHLGVKTQQRVQVITEQDGTVWMSLEHNGEQLLVGRVNFLKFLQLLTEATAAQTK